MNTSTHCMCVFNVCGTHPSLLGTQAPSESQWFLITDVLLHHSTVCPGHPLGCSVHCTSGTQSDEKFYLNEECHDCYSFLRETR